MVNIDVMRAQALNKLSGDLSFETAADNDLLDIPFVAFASPVFVTVHYVIHDDGKVNVSGTVKFRLKGQCSRCTKEIEQEISGEIDALFVRGGEDGEDYAYTGGKIMLDEAVRDAVMFALPSSFLCNEECVLPAFH